MTSVLSPKISEFTKNKYFKNMLNASVEKFIVSQTGFVDVVNFMIKYLGLLLSKTENDSDKLLISKIIINKLENNISSSNVSDVELHKNFFNDLYEMTSKNEKEYLFEHSKMDKIISSNSKGDYVSRLINTLSETVNEEDWLYSMSVYVMIESLLAHAFEKLNEFVLSKNITNDFYYVLSLKYKNNVDNTLKILEKNYNNEYKIIIDNGLKFGYETINRFYKNINIYL